MAQGDKYINSLNTNLSLEQILRKMIVEDANGDPQWANLTSSDTANPDSGSIYNTLLTKNNNNNEYAWRDGLGLVEFEGKLRMMGGWNDQHDFGPNPSDITTNQQWQSIDRGYTWVQLSDAPWEQRHSFGHGVKDSKIWVWGGDLLQNHYQKDVWSYTTAGGWVQVTPDWGSGVGDRVLFAHCVHDGYLYIAGGQNDYTDTPIMFTDIWRSADGITWSLVGNLPSGLSNFSAGCMVSLNNKLYLFSGGRYRQSGPNNYNNKIYVSLNHGASWIELGTVPSDLQNMIYAGGAAMDGKLWFLCGGKVGVGNTAGLYYSLDGLNWTITETYPTARHAAGICVNANNDELYVVAGNGLSYLDWPFAVNAIPQDATLDSDTQAYINKLFPTASAQYQQDINARIVDLKAANQWNLIQSWFILGAEYRWHSWIDVKRPTATRLGENGLPVFTANQGYTGATNKWLNTNFFPATDGGTNVLNNNLFHAIYSLTNDTQDKFEAGLQDANAFLEFGSGWTDNKTYIGTNRASEEILATHLNTYGFIAAKRVGNTSTGYRNGIPLLSVSNSPAGVLPTGEDFIGCYRTGAGGAAGFSTRTLAMRMWGSGNADIPTISSIIEDFATARGFESGPTVDALLVGAGGGGGGWLGGGGAGGGIIERSFIDITAGTYPVVIGAGGVGGKKADTAAAGSGGNTTALGLTAVGGGGAGQLANGGATGYSALNGGAGGGGVAGGAGAPSTNGGTGTAEQGYAGGNGSVGGGDVASGGGGGAGGIGQDAQSTTVGGNGGAGYTSSFSGSAVKYGGGGGGGGDTAGTGTDGGGNGATGANTASNGTANRGGGGGGARNVGGANASAGGNGGSGIVIIRYLTGTVSATGGTITASGGYTIHTFTSSGNFIVS